MVGRVFKRKRKTGRIIVNGTFHNPNWFFAHISPLAASGYGEVILICDEPIAELPNLTYVCPPAWLGRIFSRALVKFCYTFFVGLRNPADVFVGYHIFPSAVTALVCARLLGSRAVYQVAAGELELEGGGFGAENKLLVGLNRASKWVELLAHKVAVQFDLIVVRGSKAKHYIQKIGYTGHLEVVTGSVIVDASLMQDKRDIDVLFVGRLTEYKRPDRFLKIIQKVVVSQPECRVCLAGDGPDRIDLELLATNLGISKNVEFLGQRSDVPELMGRAKLFALSSRWEGVSIAMLEAMSVETVPVVTDVGDMRDFAESGVTGFVFAEDDLDGFADAISNLLNDETQRRRMGKAGKELIMQRCERGRLSQRWYSIFSEMTTNEET